MTDLIDRERPKNAICEYCGYLTDKFIELQYYDEAFNQIYEIVCDECERTENISERITGYSKFE